MRRISVFMKTALKFIPILLVYVAIVLVSSKDVFEADEGRYVLYAKNMLKGFYTDRANPYFWNGPGYSIVLMPFIALKTPWIVPKLLNALFLYLGILYFYFTLRLYSISDKKALVFSYLLALYIPFWRSLHMMMTETISYFLMFGFCFHFCAVYKKYNFGHLSAATFYLAFLMLTKIFFGMVCLVGILFFGLLTLIFRNKHLFRSFLIYALAMVLCLPYLIYTYSVTGRIFYWGDRAGINLYWMASPNPKELGGLIEDEQIRQTPELMAFHKRYLELAWNVEKNYMFAADELMRISKENIRKNPKQFVKNYIANLGRLFLNYPYAYHPQKLSTFVYLIPNMFLLVIFVLCLYPACIFRRDIPYEFYALMFFIFVTLGGSSILTAQARHFIIAVPVLAIFISFILNIVFTRVEIKKTY